MRVNAYKVVQDCVERGYTCAFKHDAAPSVKAIKVSIESELRNDLYEYVTFEQMDI
jgi:hypothetical protein